MKFTTEEVREACKENFGLEALTNGLNEILARKEAGGEKRAPLSPLPCLCDFREGYSPDKNPGPYCRLHNPKFLEPRAQTPAMDKSKFLPPEWTKLHVEAKNFSGLLDDPQPGLWFWWDAAHSAVDLIEKAIRGVKGKANSCLDNCASDEPFFVLVARDAIAPQMVRNWAELARGRGVRPEKVDDAFRIAREMAEWQQRHPKRVKIPD